MTATIRAATAADAAGIGAIWNRLIRDTVVTVRTDPLTEPEIAAIIAARRDGGHGFWVAETAGAILGYAATGPFRAGGGYAVTAEHSVALAEDARGRGLGAALMDAVEAHSRAAGRRVLIGVITDSNAGSLRFHARRGFAEWGRLPAVAEKAGARHGVVLMGKPM